MTKHENAVQALAAALDAALSIELIVDDPRPDTIPAAGLAMLRTGDPAEEDRRLGLGAIEWSTPCELVVVADGPSRRATVDAALEAVGAAIDGNRTLGGAVDHVDMGGPQPAPEEALTGADTARGVVVTFTLYYETSDNSLEA